MTITTKNATSKRLKIASVVVLGIAVLTIVTVALKPKELTPLERGYLDCMITADKLRIEDTRLHDAYVDFSRGSPKFEETVLLYESAIRRGRRYSHFNGPLDYHISFYCDNAEEPCAIFKSDDTFLKFGDTIVKGDYEVAWELHLGRKTQ